MFRCNSLWIALAFAAGVLAPAHGKTIYVNGSSQSATANGASWQTPYRNIQDALGSAVAGDAIWVTLGIYDGPLVMKEGVSLYGGFTGNETDRSQRSSAPGGSGVSGRGIGSVLTFGPGITAATVLDGFTLSDGNGTTVGSHTHGGGVYCDQASPTLNNVVISYNNATFGGAMWLSQSSPRLTNCLITANFSSFRGGGLYMDNASHPTLERNIFRTNSVSSSGSGGEAGAIFCQNGSQPIIQNNTFHLNASSAYGGAIYSLMATPVIRNNIFRENESQHGAAIYLDSSTAEVAHNLIINNRASGVGGGFLLNNASSQILGNTITGNVAEGQGSGGDGGAMYLMGDSAPALINNIIAYNSTGLFRASGGAGSITLQNNNVYGNGGADYTGVPNPGGANGNLSVNPRFVDRLFGDYHLSADSPCIDAGRTASVPPGATDIDQTARIVNGKVDIGADEFRSPYYVSPAGHDANSGLSWAQARKTIGAALALAVPGDQIWVSGGTYIENVIHRGGVKLLGGFPSGGNLAMRDWSAHPSIIDGGQAGSAVRIANAEAGARVDGFTIRNGKASSGGGINIISSSPIVANCRILSNQAVGASYEGNGGGVRASSSSSPTLYNNIIEGNTANAGGGIHISTGEPVIVNNTITGNTASNEAGGLAYDVFGTSLALFANNVIAFNSSGVKLFYRFSEVDPLFVANDVYGNTSGNYAGVPDLTGMDGNIMQDPMFRSRPGGDYRLGPGSPCVDSGRASVTWRHLAFPVSVSDMRDYAREPRIGNGTPDMGAFEYSASSGFAFADVIMALHLTVGARAATTLDVARLNVENGSGSTDRVDLRDAVRLVRKATGLDPNP